MSVKSKIIRRTVCAALVAILLAVSATAAASATYNEVPYKTYTYWQGYQNKKPVQIKSVYAYSKTVDAKYLNLDGNLSVAYFCFGQDGFLYALDTDNSRILVLNADYTVRRTIDSLRDSHGSEFLLSEAEGLFTDKDGKIYIADTKNNRILVADGNGYVIRTVGKPDSPLIPEDVVFLPRRILQDSEGFLYVLSDGCYYGAMKFDSDFNFIGFYGANKVAVTIGSAVSDFFKNLFATEQKRMNDIQKVPYMFLDFCLDRDGMIMTTTANTRVTSGQIRRLSPGGKNLLSHAFNYEKQSGDSFNYGDISGVTNKSNVIRTNYFGAIASDKSYFYALDTETGRVFVYDYSCNLICVFSGGFADGEQAGVFKIASSIAVADNGDVLVADNEKGSITIFSETEYGRAIREASDLSATGRFDEALPLWQNVNQLDKNNQLAYIGIAKAELNSGNYETAMQFAKKGLDRETYVTAHSMALKGTLKAHFAPLFAVVLVLIGGLSAFLVVSSKKKVVLIKNRRLSVAASALLHPVNSFTAVQEKGEGSVLIAAIFLLLFFVGRVCTDIYAGFMYVIPERDTYNVVYTFLGSVGLVLLWTAVNWCVCVLFEGKGRIKKIFICSCYSLYPLILYSAVFMLLSYFVSPSSVSFIPVLNAICVIYFVFMMLLAMMTVHEFSFSKALATAGFSVVGMAIVGFLIFMTIMLCQDFIGFIVSIVQEAMFR